MTPTLGNKTAEEILDKHLSANHNHSKKTVELFTKFLIYSAMEEYASTMAKEAVKEKEDKFIEAMKGQAEFYDIQLKGYCMELDSKEKEIEELTQQNKGLLKGCKDLVHREVDLLEEIEELKGLVIYNQDNFVRVYDEKQLIAKELYDLKLRVEEEKVMKNIDDLTFEEGRELCRLLNRGIENTSYSIDSQIRQLGDLFKGKAWTHAVTNIAPKSWYDAFKYLESLSIGEVGDTESNTNNLIPGLKRAIEIISYAKKENVGDLGINAIEYEIGRLSENCKSTEDGICNLPINSCSQCVGDTEKTGWISVKEQWPESGVPVNVAYKVPPHKEGELLQREMAFYKEDEKQWYWEATLNRPRHDIEILYWCPLPDVTNPNT